MVRDSARQPDVRIVERDRYPLDTSERLGRERQARLAQLDAIRNVAQREGLSRTMRARWGRVRRALEEVETAYDRLGNGTYGLCQDCRSPLPAGRLQIQPAARFCTPCRYRRDDERRAHAPVWPSRRYGEELA